MMISWNQMADRLRNCEITKEEYDRWRYRYPEFDSSGQWVKPVSQGLSDMLVEALQDEEE